MICRVRPSCQHFALAEKCVSSVMEGPERIVYGLVVVELRAHGYAAECFMDGQHRRPDWRVGEATQVHSCHECKVGKACYVILAASRRSTELSKLS